jgi:hypothetical protein
MLYRWKICPPFFFISCFLASLLTFCKINKIFQQINRNFSTQLILYYLNMTFNWFIIYNFIKYILKVVILGFVYKKTAGKFKKIEGHVCFIFYFVAM